MENKDHQRKQLEEKIIARAMKDETFRKNLLENPKAAMEDITGIKIPETINLKVVEEDPATFYLVLPPKINPETEDELSEAELEMVSGAGPPWKDKDDDTPNPTYQSIMHLIN